MTAPTPQDLVEHALKVSHADHCIVTLRDSTSATLRWAKHAIDRYLQLLGEVSRGMRTFTLDRTLPEPLGSQLERELRDHEAGFRTHLLVSLGACVFTLVSAYAWTDWTFSTASGTSLARIMTRGGCRTSGSATATTVATSRCYAARSARSDRRKIAAAREQCHRRTLLSKAEPVCAAQPPALLGDPGGQ